MTDTFSDEIPKSRMNIILEYKANKARKRKELPVKLLVLADFNPSENQLAVAERERINVTKMNLDEVIKQMQLQLEFSVPNHIDGAGQLQIKLPVHTMKDFQPDHLVAAIPELKNLIVKRNLLKDFKQKFFTHQALRNELERILRNFNKGGNIKPYGKN